MDTSTYQIIYIGLCDFSLVVIRHLKIQQETNITVKHCINNISIKTHYLHKVQKLLDAIRFLFRHKNSAKAKQNYPRRN